MKKGFSYIEVLISLIIVSIIIISSSYSIVNLLKLERKARWYHKLFYELNRLSEKSFNNILNSEELECLEFSYEDHDDHILFRLRDKKSGRIFYLYKSKILNL